MIVVASAMPKDIKILLKMKSLMKFQLSLMVYPLAGVNALTRIIITGIINVKIDKISKGINRATLPFETFSKEFILSNFLATGNALDIFI
jgi:hypothetical protein